MGPTESIADRVRPAPPGHTFGYLRLAAIINLSRFYWTFSNARSKLKSIWSNFDLGRYHESCPGFRLPSHSSLSRGTILIPESRCLTITCAARSVMNTKRGNGHTI